MKAEDLMIGDYVYIKSSDGEDTHIVKVKTIEESGINQFNGFIEFRELEPILLTTEILEKNKFGFVDTSNGECPSVWTGWWILEGLELGCSDNLKFPVFFNIADTNVKVNYVHELQHALKLCKIEKEIVL